MHNPKKKKKVQSKQKKPDWLDCIDNDFKRAAIPVGPRFQAVVPDWHEPTTSQPPDQTGDSNLDNSKWLGESVWPTGDGRQNVEDDEKIGKGRPSACGCRYLGSTECVKRHVTSERDRIRFELGPVFYLWRFDTMGEDAANSWTAHEEKKFDFFVRMNPISQDRSFLKPALTAFSSKTVYDIVNYYLNVFILRRISVKCRSGIQVLYSDDDEDVEEDEDDDVEPSPSKDSRKRRISGADDVKPDSSKSPKPQWLGGKR